MQVTMVPTKDLSLNPANPRKNDQAVEHVLASLRRFGFQQPLVARPSGMVIAGNTRLKAALRLGIETVPVVFFDGSDLEAVAYGIADNRTHEFSAWEETDLAKLLEVLRNEDALEGVGFTSGDIDELLTKLGNAALGDIQDPGPEEPPEVAVTQPGDLWEMGEHRLICGDCRDPKTLQLLFQRGLRASCVFTDPPYGVGIGAKNRMLNQFQKSGRNTTDIVDDELDPEALRSSLKEAFVQLRALAMADDCTLFVTAPQGGDLGLAMLLMLKDAGLPARHVLIWKKSSPTFSMGRLDYDYAHEPILLTWGKRHKRPMLGEHKTSVWEIAKPRANAAHPTMKPVELYTNAYLNNSDRGDAVADVFAGSGTAFIAAEQAGRRCYGAEIEPRYCDVIVKRWEAATGSKATRAGTELVRPAQAHASGAKRPPRGGQSGQKARKRPENGRKRAPVASGRR